MPSIPHQLVAFALPRVFRAQELEHEPTERAAVLAHQAERSRALPTWSVPRFRHRFAVVEERVGGFPSYVITQRDAEPTGTLFYVHGGAYVAGIDPFHVRYATRLADALGVRIVMPDYPLAPDHTWRDCHEPLVEQVARWSAAPGGAVLAGDSAGGGLALALAESLRDRVLPQPRKLLLISPWVDLTMSSPETPHFARRDPWLKLGKAHAYAAWWAGGPEEVARPEVSPGLGDLSGLPPALQLYGTRDLLAGDCRELARRATESGWDLTSIEEPDLLHVYPFFGDIPEARRAFRQTTDFLR